MKAILAVAVAMIAVAGTAVFLNFEQNGDPNERTLSFDIGDAEGDAPGDIAAISGTEIVLPGTDARKIHNTFSGWSDGSSTYQPGDTYKLEKNTELRAVWVADRFPIAYHLNGGTNPDGTADSYGWDEAYVLPVPVRDGYVFTGWYSDEGLETPLENIDTCSEAGVEAYASWEVSLVGTGITMRLTGTIQDVNMWNQSSTYTTSGSLSFDYVYYEYGMGYYLARTFVVSVNGNENVTDDGYWSNDVSDRVWEKSEDTVTITTEFGDIECNVWTNTGTSYTETQYIGVEDGELYRIVNVSRTTVMSGFYPVQRTETNTYDLTERRTFDASSYYGLEVYEDCGIDVTGDEFPVSGARLSLKATASEGYRFAGWYDSQGRLLSASDTYVPAGGRLLSDITLYARNTSECDEPFELDSSMSRTIASNRELTDVKWRVSHISERSAGAVSQPYYVMEGTGNAYHLDSAGRYTVTYSGKASDGSTVRGQYDILACGNYSFSWDYKSSTYTVSLRISLDDYNAYSSSDARRTSGSEDQMRALVTYDDRYVKELAHQFDVLGAGMDRLGKANLLLSYVQAIPYMYDSDLNGRDEYWKFPLETITDGAGDCEDTSILFCAIAKAMGYDTALMTLHASSMPGSIGAQNHCVSLVSVEGETGYGVYTTVGDVGYYFCETTSMGHDVGANPWASVRNTKIAVIV